MRITLFPVVIVLVSLAAAPTWAQSAPANTGKSVSLPHEDAATPQALTDAERCSVDSLSQRATIVALRAEIAKLQARVAELEAPLVDQAVTRERQQLEQRFRDRIKPPEGSTFNWQTLTFTPPSVDPPTKTP